MGTGISVVFIGINLFLCLLLSENTRLLSSSLHGQYLFHSSWWLQMPSVLQTSSGKMGSLPVCGISVKELVVTLTFFRYLAKEYPVYLSDGSRVSLTRNPFDPISSSAHQFESKTSSNLKICLSELLTRFVAAHGQMPFWEPPPAESVQHLSPHTVQFLTAA